MSDRDETIAAIKAALRRRSRKTWSVTGGRGTAWGWITIDAPPARRTWSHRLKAGAVTNNPADYEEYDSGTPGGHMGPADREALADLLGLESVHQQGESIPASSDHYSEYTQRAQTGKCEKVALAYWD